MLWKFAKSVIEGINGGKKSSLALSCQQGGKHFHIQLESSDSRVSHKTERLGRSFRVILEQLIQHDGNSMWTPLRDIDMMSQADIEEIWQRNYDVPKGIKTCLDEVIQREAMQHPNKTAVYAWDGELTYEELEEVSTQLALGLMARIERGQVVPVCFEKSVWMPVAILGVIKACGVILQIPASTPIRRAEVMLQTSRSRFALVGSTAPEWLGDIIPTQTVEDIRISDVRGCSPSRLHETSWDQDVALLFTSGSTGQPKGIVWTHGMLVTNCHVYAKAVSLGPKTRFFQSTSYDFDVSILETFATIMSGGCLCIPREQDGFSLSPPSMEALQANMVSLTPTEAEDLDPDNFPTLKQVVSEGEILHRGTACKWAKKVAMYNFYGPSESPLVAVTRVDPNSFQTGYAGKTSGCLSWVVNPHNHNKLLPNGAIGELLIEGPIIFDRYVGTSQPNSSFVSPDWLHRGYPGVAGGRKSRLYKTGDLVRCDSDGNLVILGRKDTQVQLHGERLELSETEHNVRQFLKIKMPLAAEVIVPTSHGRPMLALFLEIGNQASRPVSDAQVYLTTLLTGLETYLGDYLPRAYIPSAYIAIEKIPRTATGKTNRRQLREMGVLVQCCQAQTLPSPVMNASDDIVLACIMSSYFVGTKSLCREQAA